MSHFFCFSAARRELVDNAGTQTIAGDLADIQPAFAAPPKNKRKSVHGRLLAIDSSPLRGFGPCAFTPFPGWNQWSATF
jgi:hypothetical protein